MRHTILGAEEILSQLPDNNELAFTVLDCTYGQGLHSKLILEKYKNASIVACDYDINNLVSNIPRLTLKHINFIYIHLYIRKQKIKIDFVLLDLGAHMDQMLSPDYGLSFMDGNSDIDMRINNTIDMKSSKDILNSYNIDQLSNLFKYYGDLNNCTKLASSICTYRKNVKISKVYNIFEATNTNISTNKSYLAKIFQSLRLEVNQEIHNLVLFLNNFHNLFLSSDHKIKLISFTFHSLEDKILKNFFKNKVLFHGLENMFNCLKLTKKIQYKTFCNKMFKHVSRGNIMRRKNLFFIIRSSTIILNNFDNLI